MLRAIDGHAKNCSLLLKPLEITSRRMLVTANGLALATHNPSSAI